jgi:hypothetical protein
MEINVDEMDMVYVSLIEIPLGPMMVPIVETGASIVN